MRAFMNEKLARFYNDIKGKKVAVVGLGISNAPLVSLLHEHGAIVSVHDKKSADKFDPALIESLKKNNARLFFGENYLDEFDEDIIIKAPGIRKDAPGLVKAEKSGAKLTSELELFFNTSDCEKFAVTGSDGKTTTTTLTYLMLSEEYSKRGRTVHVGGNIGTPLFYRAESIADSDAAVLELSSFQLHAMSVAPDHALITNVSPNHLDWHTDYEEYIDSKRRIFKFMTHGSVVLNYSNDITRSMAKDVPCGCEVRFFSSSGLPDKTNAALCVYTENGEIRVHDYTYDSDEFVMNESEIMIPGKHNVENYMAAYAMLYRTISVETLRKTARTFKGVEHRIEFVRELDGVKYYNSSIDSSPTRTIAALRSFGGKKVIAIMGGYDKHIPYDVIGEPVCTYAKAVILTGATAPKIKAAIKNCSVYSENCPKIYEESDFERAVARSRELAESGDTVILTPASASFDRFKNFEERGNLFKRTVNNF